MVDSSNQAEAICPACDDTGWIVKSCYGTHDVICGRRRPHLAHTFAEECPCRPMNRTYQSRLGRLQRVA